MARNLRLSGAVTVILSLWLPWYAIHLPANLQSVIDAHAGQLPPGMADFTRGLLAAIPRHLEVTGWEVFGGADVAMALLAGAVILLCFVAAERSLSVVAAATLAGLVLVHVVDRPGPSGFATVKEGALVALAGAALALVGTLLEPGAAPVAARLPESPPWSPPPPGPPSSVPPPR